jgi:hypothetical protein
VQLVRALVVARVGVDLRPITPVHLRKATMRQCITHYAQAQCLPSIDPGRHVTLYMDRQGI